MGDLPTWSTQEHDVEILDVREEANLIGPIVAVKSVLGYAGKPSDDAENDFQSSACAS
jgi:hypothetical protein